MKKLESGRGLMGYGLLKDLLKYHCVCNVGNHVVYTMGRILNWEDCFFFGKFRVCMEN